MKNLELVLLRDVTQLECPWLDFDLKKGDNVYFFTGLTYNCISKGGIACFKYPICDFFELPISSVAVRHEEKEYGIFMLEWRKGFRTLFCKELPFDCKELLDKTQTNFHINNPKISKPIYKKENEILLLHVKNGEVFKKIGHLEDLEPLF